MTEQKSKITKYVAPGITLRDYFAGQALRGYIASEYRGMPEVYAKEAYNYADLMLEVRGQSK